jgi:alpha-galactosidase
MPTTRRSAIQGLTAGMALSLGGARLGNGQPAVIDASLAFHLWASTPPMGWNSWDSFATTITESQARENAQVMADRLKPHGYQFFTVDIQWYEPNATGYDYRKGAPLTMDEWGRLWPAVNRFPSAADGKGFAPLAEFVHGLGLKFGVHLMRGIPRQAVKQNVVIKDTRYRAKDIANVNSVCPWNTDMYGVDMSEPGSQAYYNSVFELFESWGVDFVKVDDMSRPYHDHEPEIEAVRHAIDRTGRPMVLSLSPGETPLDAAEHARRHANLWRISDDFWDTWPALMEQFTRLEKWNPHRGEGYWPDADMLPLGTLEMGKRTTRFTRDEQVTLMTLWSIARSPLIMGGDLRKLDDYTLSMLTNDEVLAVDQRSTNNKPVYNRDGVVVWMADAPRSHHKKPTTAADAYVAVFNTRDRPAGEAADGAPITVSFKDLGIEGPRQVRDLWKHLNLGEARGQFASTIPWHGAGLYRLIVPKV